MGFNELFRIKPPQPDEFHGEPDKKESFEDVLDRFTSYISLWDRRMAQHLEAAEANQGRVVCEADYVLRDNTAEQNAAFRERGRQLHARRAALAAGAAANEVRSVHDQKGLETYRKLLKRGWAQPGARAMGRLHRSLMPKWDNPSRNTSHMGRRTSFASRRRYSNRFRASSRMVS